jgi:hypothetical protein
MIKGFFRCRIRFKEARNVIVKEHFSIHFEVAAEMKNGKMQQNATT